MKPNRDAAALAASLSAAAAAPLRLPERPSPPEPAIASLPPPVVAAPAPKPARTPRAAAAAVATVGITLRPGTKLLNRYTLAAADRTREEGRVVSAQQIMLEVLERHAPKVGP